MLSPMQIEQAYKEFMGNLHTLAHDGVLNINLEFLHEAGLLESLSMQNDHMDDLTQYFHVVESPEKVTLFNEHFMVWIVPKVIDEQPMTYVMIATEKNTKPQLEIVFTTFGVYNSPRYVLKVLQHFLNDMLETEQTLEGFEKNA